MIVWYNRGIRLVPAHRFGCRVPSLGSYALWMKWYEKLQH